MLNLTPEEIASANISAKYDFYFFSRWMFLQRKGFNWLKGQHHKIICDDLMRVFNGECTHLIINVAPRYSKTELAVINFIAWCLGRVPDAEFIHTSYSSRLAANNSWQARELVGQPSYKEIFPEVSLRTDSQAKDEWRTTQGGVCYATGIGGTITGYGAGKLRAGFGGAIVIDDPHKADEARSDVIREGVIDWFQNTLESRKNSPHTPIILIMQRLHEKDLAGWLLGGGNGEKWEHVCLETLLPDGSALWPEKHTTEMLNLMKQASPYTFAGQYQQSPCAPEGNIFNPHKMEIFEAIPAGTKFVRAWDLAASKDSGDYTAGFKLGKMPDGRYIIANVARGQWAPETVETSLKNTADVDGKDCKIRLPQDPGQAGKSQIKSLTKMLAGYSVHSMPISGDKIVRAQPFAAQMNVGNVVMLKADWNEALISEFQFFPNGANDDQVDAGSDAFFEFNEGSTGWLDWIQEQVQNAKNKKQG